MTFKIISLDDGGIRGVIAARILIEIEKKLKNKKVSLYMNTLT
ncbi:hypothetical protein [Okeania sp. SIO1I7]|nr:hypothetical protein [Okeania sp. SIO1I7]